jgi:lipid A disaccharide synthetase
MTVMMMIQMIQEIIKMAKDEEEGHKFLIPTKKKKRKALSDKTNKGKDDKMIQMIQVMMKVTMTMTITIGEELC